MFGKKCPKCGSKLKKENVWHADKSEFKDEWTCKKCGDLPSPNKPPNKKPEPEIIQKTESKPVLLNLRVEEESQRNRQYFLTNGQPLDLATIQSKGEHVSEAITKPEKVCRYEDCNAKLTGLDSFNCKYCKQKFCVEHKQAENHNCIKTRYTKYIRKTWLRKRGQNITSGQYIVVCDTCGYVSNTSSFIEYAGEELEYHVKTQGCTEKAIFLEEDLSHEEAPRAVKSHLVREDRPFWVCAYCRPPRKFNTRDEYIAHHYLHN